MKPSAALFAGAEIEGILEAAAALKRRLEEVERQVREREEEVDRTVATIESVGGVDGDALRHFFKKPYAILPFKKNEVLVVVPKFIDFQVGWLHQETETYNVFRFSQYAGWLGEAPQDLIDAVNAKRDLHGEVVGDRLDFPVEEEEKVREILGPLLKDISAGTATIKKGKEFDVIAEMVAHGCLPYRSRPVAEEDLREPSGTIQLRPYQVRARETFMQTGATGIFYPTGAGKTYLALDIADHLKGKILVVVPTTTLKEQWLLRIKQLLGSQWDRFTVLNYASRAILGQRFTLAIFDECHKLPANTFSRLALVSTKYRIGLSASPFREDGRENYIFALTGIPVGINWKEYMVETGRTYHRVFVYVVKNADAKMREVKNLLEPGRKTLIFCDSLELGEKIAKRLKVPFIYGDTTNRLKVIAENEVIVASRVADLGVSIADLDRIIEVDFLYGSRQQELQRTGRLMHADGEDLRHDIVMTKEELGKYGKRLWGLREKGFEIEVIER
ncbi:MAG: DEAD/DEAH box helicase family protein [bacterium]